MGAFDVYEQQNAPGGQRPQPVIYERILHRVNGRGINGGSMLLLYA